MDTRLDAMNVILRGRLAQDDEGSFFITDKEGRRVYLGLILEGFITDNSDVTITIDGWECVKPGENGFY
jgi:hypothetical protein